MTPRALAVAFLLTLAMAAAVSASPVEDVKITILSDMIAGRWTSGEWGFSAFVEVKTSGGWKKLLFDTGGAPDTVARNARRLGVDVCGADAVVLSHNHQDHTMGLYELRKRCLQSRGDALSVTYVGGPQIFWARPYAPGQNHMGRRDDNVMLPNNGISAALGLGAEYERGVEQLYEGAGGRFVAASGPLQLPGFPGVWITGAIPRVYDEKTYPGSPKIVDAASGTSALDTVPEDQALVIETTRGLVVLVGCAHAGAINTIQYARGLFGSQANVYALVGGLHTFQMPEGSPTSVGTLAWEAAQLSAPGIGLQWLLGSHCTGLAAVRYLSEHIAGFDPTHGFASAIGTVFTLSGIAPPSGITSPLRRAGLGGVLNFTAAHAAIAGAAQTVLP